MKRFLATVFPAWALAACAMPVALNAPAAAACKVELVVLGVGQDAGIPQIGQQDDPAWDDPSAGRYATSMAVIDHRSGARFLFEATPDLRAQMHQLDEIAAPVSGPLGLSGVFLTHAHIGHYAGLMFAGKESASTQGLTVYAMPRLSDFLSANGPWGQLVSERNIMLAPLSDGQSAQIAADLGVMPYRVPHRDEYSETVGFVVTGPDRSALFLPDIDDWDRWEAEFGIRIEDMVQSVDVAYLDATFFDNNELRGRDMTLIPHPRVADTMQRFATFGPEIRSRIRFIHFNHSNGLRDAASPQSQLVRENGFAIAAEGERFCL